MADALTWLRTNAKQYTTDTFTITPEEGEAYNMPPGPILARYYKLEGVIPSHMAKALRGCVLANDDYQHETLRVGRAAGRTSCWYYRTTYERVDA